MKKSLGNDIDTSSLGDHRPIEPEIGATEHEVDTHVASLLGGAALDYAGHPAETKPADISGPVDEAEMPEDAAPPMPPADQLPQRLIGRADLDKVFSRFNGALRHFLFGLVHNSDLAEDLTQDVWVRVTRAMDEGTAVKERALPAWLYRIASNLATDNWRRDRRITWLPLSLFDEDHGVGVTVKFGNKASSEDIYSQQPALSLPSYEGAQFEQRIVDRELIGRILGKMSQRDAEVLMLYEYRGYSILQVAEILHCSSSAVRMRLGRARERFRILHKEEIGS